MHRASYYRDQAERARRLARAQTQHETRAVLLGVAQDYDELAEDLEDEATEIRHPELMAECTSG